MLILRNAIISVMVLSFVHAAAFFQPQHRAYQRIKSMELFPVCGSESIFSRVKDDANNRWNSFAGFRSSICRGKSRVDGEDSTSAPNKENESSSSAPMFDRHGDNSQYIADSNATRAVDDQFSLHGVSNHSSKSGSNNTIKPAVELSDYMLKLLSEVTEGDANGEKTAPVIESELPIIAIIGRPNTGKSTLVNKITSTYHEGAIVSDEAGITRDRTYRVADWEGYNFQVVDTGGIIFDDKEGLFAEQITQQALQALQEAKVAVMVVDGQIGLHPMDEELARWYRRNALKRVPVYVAVNKCESHTQGLQQVPPFYKLGLGEPLPVSGIHGNGVGELLDKVVKHIDKVDTPLKENSTNVAFIGRPNVGKSSLFNKLLGKQRAIVSDIPGTTRDSLDAVIYRGGGGGKGESTGKGKKNSKSGSRSYRIIDTAGIRRKGKIEYGSEFYMVNRAFKAIKRADVVVLLIDATRGVVDQDRILAERIEQEGRACVICMNKWDLVEDKDDSSFIKATAHIRDNLPLLKWAEVRFKYRNTASMPR